METHKRDDQSWVDTLSSIQSKRSNPPIGEGWKTTADLKKIFECGTCRMYEIINQGVANGQIEQFNGSAHNASGRIVRRVWYRLKK